MFQDDHIFGYEIPWLEMVDAYATLPSILVGFIRGFLCPDRRSKGLSVGWGRILESMIVHGTRYAWGMCMLPHLYHDLHQVVYL